MKKRVLAALMCVAMTVGLLAGCGSSSSSSSSSTSSSSDGTSATADTSQEVNLVMYVVSDRPAGQDTVDENFNSLSRKN
jgi:putative aldouronate transport system substrate-binding protein